MHAGPVRSVFRLGGLDDLLRARHIAVGDWLSPLCVCAFVSVLLCCFMVWFVCLFVCWWLVVMVLSESVYLFV